MSFEQNDFDRYRALLTREAWLVAEYGNLGINRRFSNSTGDLTRDLEGFEKNIKEFETIVYEVTADLNERKEKIKNFLEYAKQEYLKIREGKNEKSDVAEVIRECPVPDRKCNSQFEYKGHIACKLSNKCIFGTNYPCCKMQMIKGEIIL